MRHSLTLLIASMLATGTCLAHEDRILPVKEDGVIEGLPAEFGPGALRIDFPPKARPGEASIKSVVLELGSNRTTLPLCVTGMLQTRNISEVRASGSWYHEETLLPYYLNIEFFDPGYSEKNWANAGFSLLFNLRTGKLMEMEVLVVRYGGRGIQQIPVDLAERCSPIELRMFSDGYSN
jgi:hypothetical protein